MRIKYLTKLFSLGILFSIQFIYSQEKTKVIITNDYLKELDSITNVIENLATQPNYDHKKDPAKDVIKNISIKDLKHFASKMYKASDLNHLAVLDSAYKDYFIKEKLSDMRLVTINRLSTTYKLQQEIKNSISPLVYGLTRVAYFLRVNVTNVQVVIPSDEGMIKSETPVIDAIVKEVFKGNGQWASGDEIQFYYYNFWHKDKHLFEVGKEYLVPLEPRGEYPNFDKIIALVPYLDGANGFYPILNDVLMDKYNFFGFGEKVNYNLFRKKFNDKIIEVKSWE